MNRRRQIGILSVGTLLVFALVYISREQGAANGFPLLLLPLVLLAGFWLGLRGSLAVTVASAALIAAAHELGWLPGPLATLYMLTSALVFGLTVIFIQAYEAWMKLEAEARVPQEATLLRVERKARLIRGQIEDSEFQLKTLTQLYDAAKKIMGILDLNTLLDEARTLVGKTLFHHFGAQAEADTTVGFYLPEEESGVFRRFASQGHEISDEGLPEQLPPENIRIWLGEAFGPLRIRDSRRDSRLKPWFSDAAVSVLIIPLVMHEILIGLMVITSSRENAFTAAEFNQAAVLGKQVVFALRKALLYRKVQTLSITDNLTGLYVHRHFQDRLREELHRAERYRHFLSLVLIDLDHFKLVNDNHGHPTGDAVLTELAARVQRVVPATALVARYGGEEFAVILPNAAKARALQIAGVIHEVVKATPMLVAGVSLHITLSAGVSTYPEDALTQETLITTADTALYEAKRSGRDLVVGFTRHIKEKNI
ncbi:MAG: sensor domain-containing diguanylate cyclase [Candidatus Firestonebacteria bacterium]|nr:sensor domain-containing diguanylate cyclase [Candidatus Firestonebacteria bacterium]